MDWRPSFEGIRDNLYASGIWFLLSLLGAAVLAGWVWLREMVSPPILVALTIGFYGLILLAINQTRALFRKGLEQKLDGMEQRIGKLEGSSAPFVEPKFNEIIYPSPVGVLWALDIEKNVGGGPLCPRHRDRLFYKHAVGGDRKKGRK